MPQQKKEIKKEDCQRCEEFLLLAKRSRADYENLKKETERWKTDFVKFANEGLINYLLPVMDNFEEAMSQVPEDQRTQDWVIGIGYIKKQLADVLREAGVEVYGQIGDTFDPHLHEAIDQFKVKEIDAGKIVKVVRKGYKMGEKVMRAAQVIVAK